MRTSPPHRPRPLARLLAACALVLASGGVTPAQERSEEERAAEMLAEAERDYGNGQYRAAVKQYRLIARKYGQTPSGRIASQRSRPNALLGTKCIVDNGPPENRVDLALMGDGFTLDHQATFDKLAADMPRVLAQNRTLGEYLGYFNFHTFHIVSNDDNVDGFGREEDTALGALTLGTIQGHVGIDASLVEEALDELPANDGQALVFVRVGVLGSATPGIAAIGGRDAGTTIHEFGHSFVGLGDEYAERTHDRGSVLVTFNVSDQEDPEEVPWAHWIEAGARGVGVYEGANGQVRGAWKPTASGCVMLDGEFFCPPCREALVLRIYSFVDPIDGTNHPPYPYEHPASLEIEDAFEFRVQVMQPETHRLETRWWVIPAEVAPKIPGVPNERYRQRFGDRRDRGPLPPIHEAPAHVSRTVRDGVHRFTVSAKDLEPGRYRVICRAKDPTTFRGEKLPWVLRDELGLLESERAWWIVIPERGSDGSR